MHPNVNLPIYMDYQATTPMDPRVLEEMLPYFSEKFGNPHSRSHPFGWEAEEGVEQARSQIAQLINASPKDIVFTSGATESNNLALKGIAGFYGSERKHIITTQTEHKCVLDTCRHLETSGFKITYLPVQSNGLVDIDQLKDAMTPNTLLVSIMMVNNEIGVIQDIAAIGQLCRKHGVFFHTDAAQAFGKIPIDVQAMQIDLLSISGHKIYGPKGIGALYVCRKPRVRLEAIIHGGGQERAMRSGTLPTPLIVGLGKAAAIASEDMRSEWEYVTSLRDLFLEKIKNLEEIYINGHLERRIPHNLNISFAAIEGESLLMAIKDIAVSSGSACTSASLEPSYVLRALGVSQELAHTSIRFGFGRFTKPEEVEYAAQLLSEKVEKLRQMSPLWEMMQNGIDLSTIKWDAH